MQNSCSAVTDHAGENSFYHLYVPQDRLRALARGEELPESTRGTALLADISGFTALTETLVRLMGPRRGAEEIARQLNRVYDAIITPVDRHGGSVISFGGDAITCWFEDRAHPALPAALRATACALEAQQALRPFAALSLPDGVSATLTLKVALASGPARRLLLGDPAIQVIDTVMGTTVERVGTGERLAAPGEVLADEPTLVSLRGAAVAGEWRTAEPGGDRYAPVLGLAVEVAPTPWPAVESAGLREEALRPWLQPAVLGRLQAGQGELITELRPATALFVRLPAIDYDRDPGAGEHLDRYIRWLQAVLDRYGGTAMQLTAGDKGSYLYAVFGTPVAHEDDAVRAMRAALDLLTPPPELSFLPPVPVGVSQGVLCAGSYGSATRHTYTALGDDVNVAARLMQAAVPGQVWAGDAVRRAAGDVLAWQALPALRLKGKGEQVTVWACRGLATEAGRQPSPNRSPLIGREAELARVLEKLALVQEGQGQIVAVTGEAGIGKSRLVAEVIRLAATRRLPAWLGEGVSYAAHTAYLAWHPIWRRFFGVDDSLPVGEQQRLLADNLARLDPGLLPRLPLLGVALNLPLPDNDLTATFDPKLRKESLAALLADCVKARARSGPLLFVLEDAHWLDPLSRELLETVGRLAVSLPVLLLVTYRPTGDEPFSPLLAALPNFTTVPLDELDPQAVERLLVERWQASPGKARHPESLARLQTAIAEHAQGNPFYIEELVRYVSEQDSGGQAPAPLAGPSLPDSLHRLILSRIDRLPERERITLKVASIVGRVFKPDWLYGFYPGLGGAEPVLAALDALSRLDLTPRQAPEPDLTYAFKHLITHEVTYESLPYATRAQLHEQLAQWLETERGEQGGAAVDLLAYHYGRSENQARKRTYFIRAGQAAQAVYANEAALSYFRQALPLVSEPNERIAVLLDLAGVLELMGQWNEAVACYEQALAETGPEVDPERRADGYRNLGRLLIKRHELDQAQACMEQARTLWQAAGNGVGEAQALASLGLVFWRKRDFPEARRCLEAGLALARQQGDKRGMSTSLSGLGLVARAEADNDAAQAFYEECLALQREMGDRQGVGSLLNNLGVLAAQRGDLPGAGALFEEVIALRREIGDKWGVAGTINNLAVVAGELGDEARAQALHRESLALKREIDDRQGIAESLGHLAHLALGVGDVSGARGYCRESLPLLQELGDLAMMAEVLPAALAVGLWRVEPGHADQESLARARSAARLLGFLEKLVATSRLHLDANLAARRDEAHATATAVLGPDALTAAWTDGQALTVAEAVREALTL